MVAYDADKGDRRWVGPEAQGGYSSPQLVTIGGVKQAVLLYSSGAMSVGLTTGKLLWKYAWSGDGIVQPALTSEGDVLLGSGSGMSGSTGVLRISVQHEADKWSVQGAWWTSIGLKPYFNDFVVHEGYAFGFDGSMLSCINLADGKRTWKGGRYGHGQLILLSEQSLLLVLSEEGDLASSRRSPINLLKWLASEPSPARRGIIRSSSATSYSPARNRRRNGRVSLVSRRSLTAGRSFRIRAARPDLHPTRRDIGT